MTWQGNPPRSWPHRQRRASTSAGATAREHDLDSTEALRDTGDCVEQAEATLAPGAPRPDPGAAERLLADQRVVDAILEEGLHGPRHQALEDVLIGYAVPVLRQLLATGQIVSKATKLGRPPGGSEAWLDFTKADREEFARDMVADALPVFTKAVFEERRWVPDGKASLKTYFVNACILQFPALYRRWLDQRRTVRPAGLEIDPGAGRPVVDPATVVTLRDEVIGLLRKIEDRQIREVLVLRGAGYTAEDAARQVGLTPKAAEGRLARIRRDLKEQASMKPPGTRRQDTSQGGRWAQ